MPAKSKKQLKFMQAIANNPAFAKKVGVPTKVGKEFSKEKGVKKANENALMKKVGRNMAKAKMQKMKEGGLLDGPQKRATGLKINTGKNKPAGGVRFEDSDVYKRMVEKDAPAVKRMLDGPQKEAPKTTYKKEEPKTTYKKGGTVKHKGDGIATRGKTKGKFI